MMLVAMVVLRACRAYPALASAEGLFDFFFGGRKSSSSARRPRKPISLPIRSASTSSPRRRSRSRAAGSGPAFCVRSCDGKYFPVAARGGATPVQMCQAFCPASATKVFFGSIIDGASSAGGERYAEAKTPSPIARRCAPTAPATAAIPPASRRWISTLDSSLRPGDVIATTSGLVAYSGIRVGANQTAEFTPVASFPGLTADVRARLGEMKVAPVIAETVANDARCRRQPRRAALTAVPKASRRKSETRGSQLIWRVFGRRWLHHHASGHRASHAEPGAGFSRFRARG